MINLDNFIDNDFKKYLGFNFYLYGVINHEGTLNFGHYTSIIFKNHKKNISTLYNDYVVKYLTFDKNLLNKSYILIYLNEKYCI